MPQDQGPNPGPPTLPANPTPQQLAEWTQKMQVYNQTYGQAPSVFQNIGNGLSNYFKQNIGTVGSSGVQPEAVSPVQQAVSNALRANPSQDVGPKQPPADIPLDKANGPYPDVSDRSLSQPPVDPVGFAGGLTGAGGAPDVSNILTSRLMPKADLVSGPYGNLPGWGTPLPDAPDPNAPFDPSGNFVGQATDTTPYSDSGLLSGLNTQDWLGMAGLGLGAAGMFMNANTQKDQFDRQLAQQSQQFNANLGQGQALAGLNATQMNPYTQQEDLFGAAVKRALASKGPAQAQFGSTVPLNPAQSDIASAGNQFLNDNALANAAGNFEAARNHADPNGTPLDLSKTGLGAAGAAAQPAQQQAVQNALMAGTNQTPQQKDSGGGFWKTLGKIGAIAAPIVAAPFTGGASLALIGAGAGAASGALNGGGLKGALLGAGLGAIPGLGTGKGLAQGAVQPALSAGLKQAALTTAKNPLPVLTKVLGSRK